MTWSTFSRSPYDLGAFSTTGSYLLSPTISNPSIYFLGDSITNGYNISTPDSYRGPLHLLLLAGGISASYVGPYTNGTPPANKHDGIIGSVIPQHHSGALYDSVQYFGTGSGQFQPNIVFIYLGTNDCSGSFYTGSITANMETLVNQIRARSTGSRFCIVDKLAIAGDDTPNARRINIQRCNDLGWITQAVTNLRASGAMVTSCQYDVLTQNAHQLRIEALTAVHPTNLGYQILAMQAYQGIRNAMGLPADYNNFATGTLVNTRPTGSIVTLPTGSILQTGDAWIISGSGSDTSGNTRNFVLLDSTSVGPAPYVFSPVKAQVGTHTVRIFSFDNVGAASYSPPYTFTVQTPNIPPSGSIDSPTAGQRLIIGQSYTFSGSCGSTTENVGLTLGTRYLGPASVTIPPWAYVYSASAYDAGTSVVLTASIMNDRGAITYAYQTVDILTAEDKAYTDFMSLNPMMAYLFGIYGTSYFLEDTTNAETDQQGIALDISGYGRHSYQPTQGDQPTYVNITGSGGSLLYTSADGTGTAGDMLLLTASLFSNLTQLAGAVVFRTNTTGTFDLVSMDVSDFAIRITGTSLIFFQAGGNISTSQTFATGTNYILSWDFDGTQTNGTLATQDALRLRAWVNGTKKTLSFSGHPSSSMPAMTSASIGRATSGINPYNGYIFHTCFFSSSFADSVHQSGGKLYDSLVIFTRDIVSESNVLINLSSASITDYGFTRLSDTGAGGGASYTSASYQTSTSSFVLAPADVARFVNLNDGYGNLFLQERETYNYVDYSNNFDAPTYTRVNCSVTGNVSSAPISGYFAQNITLAGSGSRLLVTASFATNATASISVWAQAASGSGNIRLRVTTKQGAEVYTPDLPITTSWTRLTASVGIGNGATPVSASIVNDVAGTTQDVRLFGFSIQTDPWVSSTILTSGSNRRRDADSLHMNASQIPLHLRSLRQRWIVYPEFGSYQTSNGQEFTLLTVSTGSNCLRFRNNGTDLRLEAVLTGTVLAQSPALNFDPRSRLDCVVDPYRGTVTVRGQGIPTTNPSWIWPAGGPARVGGVLGEEGDEFFGRIESVTKAIVTTPAGTITFPTASSVLTQGVQLWVTGTASVSAGNVYQVKLYKGDNSSGSNGTLVGTANGTSSWTQSLTPGAPDVGSLSLYAGIWSDEGISYFTPNTTVTVVTASDPISTAINNINALNPDIFYISGLATNYVSGNIFLDASTNALNSYQTSSNAYPTTVTTGSSVYLSFEKDVAPGDDLFYTVPYTGSLDKITVYVVSNRNTTSSSMTLVSTDTGRYCLSLRNTNVMRWSPQSTSANVTTPSLSTDRGWHLWTGWFDGKSVLTGSTDRAKIFKDGVEASTTSAGTIPASIAGPTNRTSSLGRSSSGIEPFGGGIAAVIFFGGQSHSTGTIDTVRTNLKTIIPWLP